MVTCDKCIFFQYVVGTEGVCKREVPYWKDDENYNGWIKDANKEHTCKAFMSTWCRCRTCGGRGIIERRLGPNGEIIQ